MTTQQTITLETLKERQQRAWSSGDYAAIGTTLQITGESLCEVVDLAAGERVLDVAAGNGNAALAAARRGCSVTASDYVPSLLAAAHARAVADGLVIELREADAEALPFEAESFDAVLSTFGVMFTPDQEQAISELLRVCKSGGRIGLSNWTPDSFVGDVFTIVGRHAPPPAGTRSPLEWGTRARIGELFGNEVASIGVRTREFVFRYRSAHDWLDTFRSYYGPINRTYEALDAQGRREFASELLDLAERANASETGSFRAPSTYVEVLAVKAA